jgi:hypothetical protein
MFGMRRDRPGERLTSDDAGDFQCRSPMTMGSFVPDPAVMPVATCCRHYSVELISFRRSCLARCLRFRIAESVGCRGANSSSSQMLAISLSECSSAASHTTSTSRSSIDARALRVRASSSLATTNSIGSANSELWLGPTESGSANRSSREVRRQRSMPRRLAATTRYGNGDLRTCRPREAIRSCKASRSLMPDRAR